MRRLCHSHRDCHPFVPGASNGGVAPFGGGHVLCRPCRVQPSSDQPLVYDKGKGDTQRQGSPRTDEALVVVVVQMINRKRRVCPGSFLRAANWVAEHLGASSRRPRHPFPAEISMVCQTGLTMRNGLCATTRMLLTFELQLRDDHSFQHQKKKKHLSLLHNRNVTAPENLHDPHNRDIGHRVLQLGMSMVKRTVWTMETASAQRRGSEPARPAQQGHRPPCPATGNVHGQTNSLDHGDCLCVTTGK